MEKRRDGIRRVAARHALKLLFGAALFSVGTPVFACEPGLSGKGVERLESPRYVLAYRSAPDISVGTHFTLDIATCSKNGAPPLDSIHIDGYMPAHRHNMNYAAKVRRTGNGRWRAEGLNFHMPGEWELRFDLRALDHSERLTRHYELR